MHEEYDSLFVKLKAEIEAYPRLSGYYILKLVALDPGWVNDEEHALDALFQYCDDHPWPPPEERKAEGCWSDYETLEEEAEQEVVTALVGGPEVGHVAQTMTPDQAAHFWRRFRGLFSERARYFMGLGLGSREYVFQRGIVIVDTHRAGTIYVVESD